MSISLISSFGQQVPHSKGQIAVTAADGASETVDWRVPPGVTSVSVLCQSPGQPGSSSTVAVLACNASYVTNRGGGAGGARRWLNNIAVTPGEVISLRVGAVDGYPRAAIFNDAATVSAIGQDTGVGTGYNGGNGGAPAAGGAGYGGTAGGGGAAGNGNHGGRGAGIGLTNNVTGIVGGGDGGQSVATPEACRPSGTPSVSTNGEGMEIPGQGITKFGFGGRGNANGGPGCVRVMWPGDKRSYPDTMAEDM